MTWLFVFSTNATLQVIFLCIYFPLLAIGESATREIATKLKTEATGSS